MKRCFLLIVCSLCLQWSSYAQSDTTTQDTIRKFSWALLPGVASSPETGLFGGLIFQTNFDLKKTNLESRMSKVSFGFGYSIKRQLRVSTSFRLFDKYENYYISGKLDYRDWVDRHYGLGNDAGLEVIEYNQEENTIDTLNYLNFGLSFFNSNISVNKKIKEGLFVGVQTSIFDGRRFRTLADSAVYAYPLCA